MSDKTYSKDRLKTFIEQAFDQANSRMWERIQRATTADRLRLLDVTDALKQAKTELNAIIDGDNDNE